MNKIIRVKRNELKYYISFGEYIILSNKLKKILKKDKYCKNEEGYFIRSLYFDSVNNKAFHEKMAGVENRKKYRLRIYNFKDNKVKFEIKNKNNNQIKKETAVISRKDALQVGKGELDVLLKYKNPILNKIYCTFKSQKFHPIVLIDYIREPYVYEFNDVRITFDKCLASNSSKLELFDKNASMRKFLNKGLVIMEIKYNGFLPLWIRDLMQIRRFKRCAISKYCLGRMAF